MYFLAGNDPEHPDEKCVYIGQSRNVFERLKKHESTDDKEFWARTIIIVSKDRSLNVAHVEYLESCLIRMAKEAGRAKMNQNSPALPSLSEGDRGVAENILGKIETLLPVLGLDALKPSPSAACEQAPDAASPIFFLKGPDADAKAYEINGEFVVKEGSTTRKEGVSSWTSYKSLRERLVNEGRLVEKMMHPTQLIFAKDVSFTKPSAAASVVLGRNANGRIEWKVKDSGQTYGEWFEAQLGGQGEES